MSDFVLIATPARKTTPEELLEMNAQVVTAFTYPDFDRVVWPNEQTWSPKKYEPNARARNEFIDLFLRPWHDWVLWMDADIIDAPRDLLERLIAISEERNGAIVAPMVWMERIKDGPVALDTGGWFYDTGGFVDFHGQYADFHRGVAGNGYLAQMRSVGTCYLVPSVLYRRGLRYRPEGNEVEHLSFCRAAAEAGTEIYAARTLNVTHAYLPKYGEAWHSS